MIFNWTGLTIKTSNWKAWKIFLIWFEKQTTMTFFIHFFFSSNSYTYIRLTYGCWLLTVSIYMWQLTVDPPSLYHLLTKNNATLWFIALSDQDSRISLWIGTAGARGHFRTQSNINEVELFCKNSQQLKDAKLLLKNSFMVDFRLGSKYVSEYCH